MHVTCLQSWGVLLELEGTFWNTVKLNLTLVVNGYILGELGFEAKITITQVNCPHTVEAGPPPVIEVITPISRVKQPQLRHL